MSATLSATHFSPDRKTGILFLNMGGPDTLADVRPFLINLFSDPDIIRLPLSFLFQKPLARWIVSRRGKEAEHNYRLLGGGSPQLARTREQADALHDRLKEMGHDLPVFIAMRYWQPDTETTLRRMQEDGIEQVVVVSMYPQFSYTTTGSSLNELRRVMRRMNLDWPLSIVGGYHHQADYQTAFTQTIHDGLNAHAAAWTCPPEDVHILFSAHSLPLRHIKRTKDPYPDLIFNCARRTMESNFPANPWDLCYQSKVGNMPWLGPYTESALQYLAAKNCQNVLVVPISFVCDHIETLVEIDLQYLPLAREMGIPTIHRAPTLNKHPMFIEALAGMVSEKLQRHLPEASGYVPVSVATHPTSVTVS
ncbi:MAG: ferrochelatase [Candidatus Melainabacteria bacterium]